MSLDLLIVGAGPAGIGAAVEAAAHGLSVMVLDENGAPGGRIWQALEALRAVSFLGRDGWKTEEADMLLLHDGVIPSVQMTRAVGCAHTWNDTQRCWQPVVDEWGRTPVPGVLVAGDGAGVGGAAAAVPHEASQRG